ncbi:MAG: RNA methyltransferase [Legionellales bacterium]|nr:RNA methyltransferase [Legionellales bacterium]
MLSNIQIILVKPSHPGNIGSAVRAMEVMGIDNLILVSPKHYEHPDIVAMAANAVNVLQNIKVVETLAKALEGVEIVIGTSARSRCVSLPKLNSRECGEFCVENIQKKIAILFGSERIGLTNEELMCCSKHVYIPTNENYGVLNLAMAVQIICYDIRMASQQINLSKNISQSGLLAEYHEMNLFYLHLEKVLKKIRFFHSSEPKKLMLKLRRLFNRASIEKSELNILRGILKSIDEYE